MLSEYFSILTLSFDYFINVLWSKPYNHDVELSNGTRLCELIFYLNQKYKNEWDTKKRIVTTLFNKTGKCSSKIQYDFYFILREEKIYSGRNSKYQLLMRNSTNFLDENLILYELKNKFIICIARDKLWHIEN